MGACGSKKTPVVPKKVDRAGKARRASKVATETIEVVMPLPMTLNEMWRMGQTNTNKALSYLRRLKKGDFCEPYEIAAITAPGEQPRFKPFAVVDVPDEARVLLRDGAVMRKSARKHEAKTGEKLQYVLEDPLEMIRRREWALMFLHRGFLHKADLIFTTEFNLREISDALPIPMKMEELRMIVEVFIENSSPRRGLFTLSDLKELVYHDNDSLATSPLLPYVYKVVNPRRTDGLQCDEFVRLVHNICIMNDEEKLRYLYRCLAHTPSRTDSEVMLIDADEWIAMYDHSGADDHLEAGQMRTIINSLATRDLRRKSHAAQMGLEHGRARLLNFKHLIYIQKKHRHVTHPFDYCRKEFHLMFFGPEYWAKREKQIRARARTSITAAAHTEPKPPAEMMGLDEFAAKLEAEIEAEESSRRRASTAINWIVDGTDRVALARHGGHAFRQMSFSIQHVDESTVDTAALVAQGRTMWKPRKGKGKDDDKKPTKKAKAKAPGRRASTGELQKNKLYWDHSKATVNRRASADMSIGKVVKGGGDVRAHYRRASAGSNTRGGVARLREHATRMPI